MRERKGTRRKEDYEKRGNKERERGRGKNERVEEDVERRR